MSYVCMEVISMLIMAGNLKTDERSALCDMMHMFGCVEIFQLVQMQFVAVTRGQGNWSPSLATPA
jgi:hypothetical protein